MDLHDRYRAEIEARNRSVKVASSVELLVRVSCGPDQLLDRSENGLPHSLPIDVAALEQRMGTLGGHQRRLQRAVLFHQDGGGPVDVELGGHWSECRALTFFQNHFGSAWMAEAISSLTGADAASLSANASGCAWQ